MEELDFESYVSEILSMESKGFRKIFECEFYKMPDAVRFNFAVISTENDQKELESFVEELYDNMSFLVSHDQCIIPIDVENLMSKSFSDTKKACLVKDVFEKSGIQQYKLINDLPCGRPYSSKELISEIYTKFSLLIKSNHEKISEHKENTRRILIDVVLFGILENLLKNKDNSITWTTEEGFTVLTQSNGIDGSCKGKIDYYFKICMNRKTSNPTTYFLIVEAKKTITDSSSSWIHSEAQLALQLIAKLQEEMREEEYSNNPSFFHEGAVVWGILTDGKLYKFYFLDWCRHLVLWSQIELDEEESCKKIVGNILLVMTQPGWVSYHVTLGRKQCIKEWIIDQCNIDVVNRESDERLEE
jgi:hypothetical protein